MSSPPARSWALVTLAFAVFVAAAPVWISVGAIAAVVATIKATLGARGGEASGDGTRVGADAGDAGKEPTAMPVAKTTEKTTERTSAIGISSAAPSEPVALTGSAAMLAKMRKSAAVTGETRDARAGEATTASSSATAETGSGDSSIRAFILHGGEAAGDRKSVV